MGIRFSLLLAFRQRVHRLKELIDSLLNTTKNIDSIELFLAVDEDDVDGLEYLKNTEHKFIRYSVFKRSEHFTKDYLNPLAREANGRWLINLNDDSVFMTKDWDEIVYNRMDNEAKAHGDDIFLGLVKDGMIRTGENERFPHFSSWPVVSKESVNALGYLFNEKFYIWGVDHFIADVYRRIGRLVSLTDVHIDHNSHHNKRREKDEFDVNYDRFCAIETIHGFSITEDLVENEAVKFINYLKTKGSVVNLGPLTIF